MKASKGMRGIHRGESSYRSVPSGVGVGGNSPTLPLSFSPSSVSLTIRYQTLACFVRMRPIDAVIAMASLKGISFGLASFLVLVTATSALSQTSRVQFINASPYPEADLIDV